MKKVLYILHDYPQLSQTYIKTEIEALQKNYKVFIVSIKKPNYKYNDHQPYKLINDVNEIIKYAKEIKPDFIHTHWIFKHLPKVYKVSKALNIPFTIRAHSFDVLDHLDKEVKLIMRIKNYFKSKNYVKIINSKLCLGVLTYPFTLNILEKKGINKEKLISCYPVLNFDLFYDTSKNGNGIISMGAVKSKKKFEDYLELSECFPKLNFDLFPIGSSNYLNKIIDLNNNLKKPINIKKLIEHNEMPAEYKKNQWLVYNASKDNNTVGWPVSIVEAQASGVGVCMVDLRSDIKTDYIGESGIVFSSVKDLVEIISKPVPEEMRKKGFENAKKSDIKNHIHLLTDLWK